MNRQELIKFIKYQIDVELTPITNEYLNIKNTIYVEIKKQDQFKVLSLLDKKGIRHEEHLNNKYWIYIKED